MHIIFHSILFFIWTNIFEIYYRTQIILTAVYESKNITFIILINITVSLLLAKV